MNRLHLGAILTLATLQPAAGDTTNAPIWMMVQHDVADLHDWREVFESGLEIRQEAGELSFEVLEMSGPLSSVIGIFKWTNAKAALAFVNSSSVRAGMTSAGVTSKPVITIHQNDPRYWITSDKPSATSAEMISSR